ncbi:MAG: NAD-dependent epimerase/dehydratase family protein [Planctomycetota bacterium]
MTASLAATPGAVRIGVTGPRGFIAGRLIERINRESGCESIALPRSAWEDPAALDRFVAGCQVVVHLAGMNRGEPAELESGNAALAEGLAEACRRTGATPHIVYASTTQRDTETPYGRGKRAAEETLAEWANSVEAALTTLVIPNVYGAGCRPYYNSVVATFCHQLTHGETPRIEQDRLVEFVWVNDLVEQIIEVSLGPAPGQPTLQRIVGGAKLRVSELLATLDAFRADYFDRDVVPDITSPLRASLYSTFLSYVELDDHRHSPPLHTDDRGALCEVIKTSAGGQVFFSTTKPGVIRGNHYHTRKVEWFCVVRGDAAIRLRRVGDDAVKEFRVSGDRPEFISIPVLHTHSIENVGDDELLTMFWCNEVFDASDADTHFEKVA